MGQALRAIAFPFSVISNAKNIPAIRHSLSTSSAQDINKINTLVLSPLSAVVEKIGDSLSDARVFLDRLMDRFVKSPVGTATFLIQKLRALADSLFSQGHHAVHEPSGQGKAKVNTESPEDKERRPSGTKDIDDGINETLVILILTAIFLILFDWRRQRARARHVQ